MTKFNVKSAWETVQYIIDHEVGIARFGDGEEKLALGRKIKSQLPDKALAKRLQEIARGDNPKCIIGIPNIFDGIKAEPGTKAHHFWSTMLKREDHHKIYDPKKQYYSSFITRFDNESGLACYEYIDLLKKIWEGKNVVTVSGKDIKFCKHPYLLDNCNIIGEEEGPNCNAWNDYPNLLSRCIAYPKDTVFLIRLGPTATVLAYDLGLQHGYQALDTGHLSMFVNRFITGNPNAPEPEYLNYGKPMSETLKDG